MIKTFNVDNFKSLNNLSINLQPMTVIVGNNATGKVQFYRQLTLYADVLTMTFQFYWRGEAGRLIIFVQSLYAQGQPVFHLE